MVHPAPPQIISGAPTPLPPPPSNPTLPPVPPPSQIHDIKDFSAPNYHGFEAVRSIRRQAMRVNELLINELTKPVVRDAPWSDLKASNGTKFLFKKNKNNLFLKK